MNRDKFLLLLLVLAFATLTIELRYMHAGVWSEHWQAYIPVATCAVAFLCCLGALAADRKLATVLGWVLLLCSLSGFAGVYFHTEGDLGQVGTVFQGSYRGDKIARAMDDGDDEKRERESGERPLLAPLSIAGLSLMGAVLAFSQKRKA